MKAVVSSARPSILLRARTPGVKRSGRKGDGGGGNIFVITNTVCKLLIDDNARTVWLR